LFYNHINKQHQQKEIESENETKTKKKYKSLININGLTEKIQKCVRSVEENIIICPKNIKTVKGIYNNVKDKIDKNKQTNLIYKIECLDCENSYYGMTHRQYLGKRIDQHFEDIKYLHRLRENCKIDKVWDIEKEIEDKINSIESKEPTMTKHLKALEKQCEKSGLVAHHIKNGHRFNFQNVKIIDKECNKKKLEILEVLHIKTNNNTNKKEDINRIKNTYDGILQKVRKSNERRKGHKNKN
jgi:hypothetical protein